MADSTPILAALPCPECAGRGCRWCAHSGRWPDPTVGAVRSVAALFRRVGRERSAAQLSRAADLAESASNVVDFPGH